MIIFHIKLLQSNIFLQCQKLCVNSRYQKLDKLYKYET